MICCIFLSSAPPRSGSCISLSIVSRGMRPAIRRSFPAGLVASHSVTSKWGWHWTRDQMKQMRRETPYREREEIERSGWSEEELRECVWESQASSCRSSARSFWLALKNTGEEMRVEWEVKRQAEGGSDGVGCTQVTSCHGERGTGLPRCSAGWEASSDTAAVIWELTGRRRGRGEDSCWG